MNFRDQDTIRAPSGKDDICAVFIIDTPDEPFVLQDITGVGQEYTLSFYAKSESAGGISVADKSMSVDADWKRYVITFTASSADVDIYFTATGTYYLYNTQLEIGNKDTDWSLNPADTEEEVETLKTSTAELKVTVDSITTKVIEQEDKLTITETLATQTAEKFEWIVKSGESATTFTLTDRMAEIIAETISLNGDVKVSGDMLVDGSITAAKIDTENLFAQKLTATDLHITGTSTFEGAVTATSLKAKDALVIYDQFGNEITALSSVATTAMSEKELSIGGEGVSRIDILNPVRFSKAFHLYAGMKIVEINEDGFSAYGSGGSIDLSTANGTVNLQSGSKEAQYNATNDLRSGRFVVSGTGKIGLYDATNSEWIISSDMDKQVTVHNRLVIPPEGTAANRPASDNVYSCGHSSYRYTDIYSVNGINSTSDEREKEILQMDMCVFSDFFMRLKPLAYRWLYGGSRKIHFGLGAQSTERSLLEAGYSPEDFGWIQHDVLESPTESGLLDRYGLNYQDIQILTMMQCQQNARCNENMDNRILRLEEMVAKLVAENEKLKNELEMN